MVEPDICLEMVYEDVPFVDRFERVADLGASAVEFWSWWDKDLEAVERELATHDLDLVALSGNDAPLTDPGVRAEAVGEITDSIEVAEDLDCPNLIVLAGPDQPGLDRETQREAVEGALREAAPAAEAAGVSLLLEPLNTAVDHPGHFLEFSGDGYDILRAVDSPAVGLLFDIYHQQVTEGNIIHNVTGHLDLIGHLHAADVPGRHEPGTGELNYANVVEAVADAGYDGHVGFEFTPAGDDDGAVERIVESF